MEKIDILEEKIHSAVTALEHLREKNVKMQGNYHKLLQENEYLLSENRQVRRLMAEIDSLREERRLVRQKCERLVSQYQKLKI